MTSHIHPRALGSAEHDVHGGLSRQRPQSHGHGAHPAQPRVVHVPAGIGSANYPDETTNETQRLLRRLPSAMRVTTVGAANGGTEKKVAHRGKPQEPALSDAAQLIGIFQETVARMDAAGERRPGSGSVNGWTNNWLGGTGIQPKYLKCADQAAEVMGALAVRAHTRAKWTYTFAQRIPGPVPVHVWVKAQSDNPSDPVLHLDAWNNEVRIEPPATDAASTEKSSR